MIDRLKQIALPLIIFFISLFVIHLIIPDYHPFGGVKLSNTEKSILQSGKKYLNKTDVKYDVKELKLEFLNDENFINWINSKYPLNEANKILRNSNAAYFWQITQAGKNDSSLVVSSNSDGNILKKDQILQLKMMDDGRVISFIRKIKNSLITKSLTASEAKNLAIDFVHLFRSDIIFFDDSLKSHNNKSLTDFFYKEIETFQKPDRIEYKISWQNNNPLGYQNLLTVMVIGNQVESFVIAPVVPAEFKSRSMDIFEVAKEIIFLLIIVISVIVLGFKRFRAFEIGFKQAIIFGIIVLVSFVAKQILERYTSVEMNLLLGLILGGIFICGVAIILWSVSETIFREIWNEKFLSIDLVMHKKFVHSIVGKSLLNGISFGLGLTALFFILLRVISITINVTFTGDYFTSQSHLTAYAPPLNILFGVINSYGILAVSFFMFLTAAIKRFINNDSIFILISGLIWALLIQSNVNPLTASLPINLVLGLILSLILIRYDLLTTLISYLLLQYFIKASEFAFIQQPALHYQWFVIIGLSLFGIILGIIFLLKKDKFTDYDSITPKFVENVTERQRLRRELDVARHVQMSFLPKENPKIKGIDIASICIPAFEVGGDYYDFIQLSENKFGIIIGDVSGKGTQAAFYMTLTKGFLKALAKQSESPSEVLSKMNELFYENVERGRFISMIYAVVDLEKKIIKIARAGHNPVILHDVSGKVNLISPNGLALGLEKGPLFRKVISEFEEKLESGKNFIFYTDGFTEAANKKDEEFGVERLSEIAMQNYNKSADEMLKEIIKDVQKFIGKAKQHDDMTMVIVKVN